MAAVVVVVVAAVVMRANGIFHIHIFFVFLVLFPLKEAAGVAKY